MAVISTMSAATLTPGSRIAHYELIRLLGRGGMGEVFEAQDTLLHRRVALKLLPAGFASDSSRATRFQREARALAALTHPNIATLYSFDPGSPLSPAYLVVELVPGETLARRLKRGALPPAEALALAVQMAAALEAAHEHGVIHRDIKPANIQITPEGHAKVLDFGLARAGGATDSSEAMTAAEPATEVGAILGTPAYMAPEQARGLPADARTDVFAFGCVLFEMLTAHRAFAAPTPGDALAAVLTAEPDYAALPAGLPPRLLDILKRSLAKAARERWQAMGDLRYELESLQHDVGAASASAPLRPPRRWLPIAAAVVIAASLAVYFTLRFRPHAPAGAPVQFSFDIPGARGSDSALKPLAISPDGSTIALATLQMLFLRRLGQEAPLPLVQGMGARSPAFSPDGRWIAYWSNATGELQKSEVGSGLQVTLASVPQPSGIFWGENGQILVGEGAAGTILAVPAAGGVPRTVVTTRGNLCCPQLLPDGTHVLFTLFQPPFSTSTAQVVVAPLRAGSRKTLVQGGFDARYIGTPRSGSLLYAVNSTLMRAPFDPTSLLLGTPAPLLDGVSSVSGASNAHSDFAVSQNGTLAWMSGPGQTADTTLAITALSGKRRVLPLPPNFYADAVMSPDSREIAVQSSISGGNYTISIVPLSTGALRRLTFAGSSGMPIWSPDSRYIAFESTTSGNRNGLWVERADGSTPPRNLSYAPVAAVSAPDSWSPDGKTILFSRHIASIGVGVWSIPAAGGKPKQLVLGAPHAGRATFAPNGHWFAYYSDQTGRNEIWVQPFPPTGAKYQISYSGGNAPRWSRDGTHLYYLVPHGSAQVLNEVAIHYTPSFSAGSPQVLPANITSNWLSSDEHPFDILPNGFLAAISQAPSAFSGTTQIHVRLHAVPIPH